MRVTRQPLFRKLNGNSSPSRVYLIAERTAPMLALHFRVLLVAGFLAAMRFGALLAATSDNYDPWPDLVQDIFNSRQIDDGAEIVAIEMPYRAEDAAIVPVTLRVRLLPTDSRRVVAITLVIDQ